jgi:hypothetical protein
LGQPYEPGAANLPPGRGGQWMQEIAPCDAPAPTLTNVCAFQIGWLLIGVHRGPLWVADVVSRRRKPEVQRFKGTTVGCSAIAGFPG